MGRRFYFPSEGSRATDFYRRKNTSPSTVFETANLGSNGKHANHYITEDDSHSFTYTNKTDD
jgi:hypothetical protein